VLHNRNASVINHNERAAKYYEQIFLHDWENRSAAECSSVVTSVYIRRSRWQNNE